MDELWQIVRHTPTWVFFLFLYLLFSGVRASRVRELELRRVVVTPALLAMMQVYTLSVVMSVFSAVIFGSWLAGLLAGGSVGWFQAGRVGVEVDRAKGMLRIPGSWSTLVVILFIFGTKYFFNYEMAAYPDLAAELGFKTLLLAVSALCTGVVLGRTLFYLRQYQQAAIKEQTTID